MFALKKEITGLAPAALTQAISFLRQRPYEERDRKPLSDDLRELEGLLLELGDVRSRVEKILVRIAKRDADVAFAAAAKPAALEDDEKQPAATVNPHDNQRDMDTNESTLY